MSTAFIKIQFSRYLLILPVLLLFFGACSSEESTPPLFQKLSPEQTGISFSNSITTSDSVHAENNAFIYNGAGVATGDINNDGLADIFFTGNMVSSRLYLNRGNMEFEDITESAGVSTSRWATGASMVDINGDGYLDIYVSVSNSKQIDPDQRRNLLFINNGDQTFTESAEEYGIDDSGFTTHATFLDYDRDGDLDLFLLNNSPEEFSRGDTGNQQPGFGRDANPAGFDQLYRNNADNTFTNVSEEAGILRQLGYGLGVVVADLNGDGWPDIYVSNDITPNDVLYINNRDGTFTNKAAEWLRHTSFAGMGIDIADFTNNGWPDILQTDMMPEKLSERKRMSGSTTYGGFMDLQRRGFFPHYNMNTLQMNQGIDENGDVIFSEIARLAGVAYTHWSWSALFGDYDNDGFKDISITNGYPKAVNDFDYQSDMHSARRISNQEEREKREQEILNNLHEYKTPNYIFRNNGDLTFSNKTNEWGVNHSGFSYGAAQADLNNNGRLDLIINNIDSEAFIYENVASKNDSSHFFQINLQGALPNIGGIGSNIILTAGEQKQYIYHTPYRGYMSTMDDKIHFGLGDAALVDSLEIIWPNGRYQLLTELEADQVITLRQEDATEQDEKSENAETHNKFFEPITPELSIQYRHQLRSQEDYNVQPLLPYMISKQGPPIAVGDVTGNGLDDVFIGGAAGDAGKLFLQQEDGTFIEPDESAPWEADNAFDDWGALFFDVNGDGDLDLYVASGGYHLAPSSELLQDRLYLNQGNGRFIKALDALPTMLTSTSSVAAGDFTGNGRTDLFVGGRMTPRNYPHPAPGYILRNDGGRFTDVTDDVAPELSDPGGMITDAVWIDFNGDKRTDLVTVGEWMPIQFFANDGNRLNNVTDQTGLPSMRGWWYSLAAGDFNNDGHTDLVAGNLGLNYSYATSEESRFGVYAIEAGGIQSSDIILTQEVNNLEYPFDGLARVGRVNYEVALRFPSFESYSTATVSQLYNSSVLNESLHYQVDTFESTLLKNNGDGTFTNQKLPNHAQISPIKTMIAHDIDNDGNLDLISAGNIYQTEPNTPRADAGNGLWMKGDGNGNFHPVPTLDSGLLVPKDVRSLAIIRTVNGRALIVGNNNDTIQVFRIQQF